MAKDFATKVYAVTAQFPRHEDYGLKCQLNRAVNSISLNIAEGTAKNSNKAFDYHLEIALEVGLRMLWPRHTWPWIGLTSPKTNTKTCILMVNDFRRVLTLSGTLFCCPSLENS